MADRPVLACVSGPMTGQVIPIEDGGMEIGRSPENDLVLDGDGVSRFHARLLYDNGALWIRDAGSRNGVFINDARLADHKALKVGDQIAIGPFTFDVRWEETTSPPARTDETPEPEPVASEPEAPRPKRPWYWPFD